MSVVSSSFLRQQMKLCTASVINGSGRPFSELQHKEYHQIAANKIAGLVTNLPFILQSKAMKTGPCTSINYNLLKQNASHICVLYDANHTLTFIKVHLRIAQHRSLP